MARGLFLFIILSLLGCSGQSPQKLVVEGDRLGEKGSNPLSACICLANACLNAGVLDQTEPELHKTLLQNSSLPAVALNCSVVSIDQEESEKILTEVEKIHSKATETAESPVKNDSAHDALLLPAHVLMPAIPDAAIHLAQANIQSGDSAGAGSFTKQVRAPVSSSDVALVSELPAQL